jgi:hypothetical protein
MCLRSFAVLRMTVLTWDDNSDIGRENSSSCFYEEKGDFYYENED